MIFLNSNEDKIKNPTLKSLCVNTENCISATIVTALGGTIELQHSLCCMVCNPSCFKDGGRLYVLQVGRITPRKKRRVAVRKVDDTTMKALKTNLKEERDK